MNEEWSNGADGVFRFVQEKFLVTVQRRHDFRRTVILQQHAVCDPGFPAVVVGLKFFRGDLFGVGIFRIVADQLEGVFARSEEIGEFMTERHELDVTVDHH